MRYVQIKILRSEFFFADANKKVQMQLTLFRMQMRHPSVVIVSMPGTEKLTVAPKFERIEETKEMKEMMGSS
jgi:hypothetical protein